MAAPAFPIAVWLAEKAAEVVTAAAVAVYIAIVIDDETDLEDLEDFGDIAGPTTEGGTEESQDQSQDAESIPGSTTDVGTRTEECEDCNDCKPRDGYIHQPLNRNYHVGGGDWVFYQLYIANMGGGPFFNMVGGRIQEWRYNGVDFDGFWSSSCTLVEAKKGYERFLSIDENGIIREGKVPFMITTIRNFITEAQAQVDAIAGSKPLATLRWYFSAQSVYLYFLDMFESRDMKIECYFLPYSDLMPNKK
ncbi:restriction endonuclease fold toxin 5 domain-containing protein [Halomonas sp. DP8Y7-1]|uniref:Tox-REase-5 domain-containing protein n=1 Tax=Halomonas sp. DP8Y7-1 TaxID=2859078 RepID=UPI001C978507|nr:Tox-REase-5 domain-containing protein [Halomonas sp. DP8Y7-1]MBY6029742.1 restriction endonuclease fold toxin 5 domain-containing protein [Halomonas sp. DP8Y7-1]